METLDGRSDANLEEQNQVRQRTSMTESQREKRKSEVLIAAQSIDNEVQNVKSLKRISIGSIDLLMDPELEFRVNVNSPNTRKSWSSNSSSSGEEHDVAPCYDKGGDEGGDSISDGADDSFDTTGADYLQTTNHSSGNHQSTPNAKPTSPQVSVKRTLTGVGSLRRGGVNIPTRKLSSASDNGSEDGSGSSSITKQLLWVPAAQHPSVKPENFLELVQDTLHNIQLDEKKETTDNDSDEGNKDNAKAYDRLPIDITRKRDSLVRRPSRLRKSYTEFEEYDETESLEGSVAVGKESQNSFERSSITPCSSGRSSRTVSLKDITEELNKISNNAGLTSSDAITLARTLSMAGSFASSEFNEDHDTSKRNGIHLDADEVQNEYNKEDDNEFASNMLMKHGLVIPARSSLRRSKFNTYRVRSSGSTSSLDDEQHEPGTKRKLSSNLENVTAESSGSQQDIYHSPSIKGNGSIMSSPSSINDFQDIYDHYRQPSVDWEKELKKGTESDDSNKGNQLDFETSKEIASSKINDLSQGNAKPSIEAQDMHQASSTAVREVKEKRSGWSWLNGMGSKETNTEKNVKDTARQEVPLHREPSDSHIDEDFEKTSTPVTTELQRSNHSKNRHLPIFPANESSKRKDTTEEPAVSTKMGRSSSSDSSNLTRQMFEKKIANLFRRKGKKKLPDFGTSRDHTGAELKSKRSSDNLSKFAKTSKTPVKLRSESRVEENLRNSVSKDVVPDTAIVAGEVIPLKSKAEDLPALQPAVSVTSTKSTHVPLASSVVIESVKELDGDDSQDVSMDQNAQTSIDISTETLSMKEQTSEAQTDVKQLADKSPHQPVPPRKLTFDDVKRPEQSNAPMKFTDSAFGFPLPMLTVSTVIMFDHRLPINVERAIYRLSHLKLSDPKRELRQQVVLSNFMYAYLNLVNHTLYMEQVAQENDLTTETSGGTAFKTEHNSANGSICIPEM